MTTAQPGQEQRMERTELVGWLSQYAHDFAVPIYARDAMEKAVAELTRPTADLGDDGELVELRAERDALLQRPIDLAKMDSIDNDVADRMVAYYWCEQALEARDRIELLREALEKIVNHASSVPDSHMECGECHDAYADDCNDMRRIARAVLSRSGD